MRNFLLIIFLLPALILFSQEDGVSKYQSLFWKIEGKGMEKPSYLYGTMHVSNKIAYHLNDEFYQALRDVDQIGLETNPEDWMDKMLEEGGNNYGANQNLYKSFMPIFPEEDNFKYVLKQNNELVNGILYRNSDVQQNFQEETYLDMFIYQAGGKLGKPVYALEDLDVADDLAKKASIHSYDPDKEHSPWLKKKLQEKGIVELVEEAYRDKNLDLIDSLNRDYYSDEYNEYMLYQRNRNIVVAMDSVMKKGTLFVGIGAAHLPGEKGVIEYLRKEGYTLTPITGELSKIGLDIKDHLENTFAEREHSNYHSADHFISVELPDKLYEFNSGGKAVGVSMDITNGAYFFIFRTNTYSEFAKEKFGLDEIEKMLYENIPGKIEKQNRIQFQGFPAIEIENILKNGEHQKYLIVETPLEIIVFKLGGKKDYAKKNAGKFFDNLKLKTKEKKLNKTKPFYGDFEISLPGNPIISGNHISASSNSPLEIQSINKNGGYYFAQSLVYNDFRYLEEDDFELEYIQKKWYETLDTSYQKINTHHSIKEFPFPHSFSNSNTKDGKEIYLFSIKKGPRYYLLGTVGVDSLESVKYFNSMNFIPYIHKDEKYEIRKDTSLYFSVVSSVEAPPFFDYYGTNATEDSIQAKYQNITFETPYKELVNVSYNKYHNYYEIEHIDTIWAKVKRSWEKDYIILDHKKGIDKKGLPFFILKIGKENCTREINNYYYLNHGVMYLVQFDSYTETPIPVFIDTFLQTFSINDTLIGRSPLESKSELFFENIYSQDSLTRIQSLNAYEFINFDSKDVPQLMKVIQDFNFNEDELDIKVNILQELGKINDPRVFPFLKNIYTQSEDNSLIQLEVISALAKNPSEKNFNAILELLEADIPLSSERKIYTTFSPLKDSTALQYGSKLFPDLLNYSSIPEYKVWIYQLAVKLKDMGYLKNKILKKYKNLLVNEMKIEYKRQKTKELNNKSNSYGYNSNKSNTLLDEYISLLAPFYSDTEIKEIFKKTETLDNSKVKSVLLAQLSKHHFPLDKTLVNQLAENPSTRLDLYTNFKNLNQLDAFPSKYKNQKDIAEAYLLKDSGYPKIDSTIFIKEVSIVDKKDKYVIYFFKSLKKENYGYGNKKKEGEWGIQYIAYKKDEKIKIQSESFYDKSNYKEIDFEDSKEVIKFEKEAIDNVKYKKRYRINPHSPYRNNY